ncbi:helix-turn-helix domain-containing protein [Sphingomonas sp. MMS24-J45]|uniref:helix-turn-helix domain-containing protein n=1 Tax=Sphingomonas sp. MMS24-J45 TaxID=3238806 RepID=UPI00384E1C51
MSISAEKAERPFEAFDGVELGLTPGVRPGALLRQAREAMGATLADVSQHTRITERHLELIEAGAYQDFHGRIYAVGFARSYARFVGLAEHAIVAAVRDEYDDARPSKPVHHWA